MNIKNLLKIALKALNNNKMRCFLTMLGVIIGVGAVIAMLDKGTDLRNGKQYDHDFPGSGEPRRRASEQR